MGFSFRGKSLLQALEQSDDEGNPQRRLLEMAKKLADSKLKERQKLWSSSVLPKFNTVGSLDV